VLLPPLQVKLGLTKQSVKALCQDVISLEFFCVSFLQVTYDKSVSVVFVSPETKRNTWSAKFAIRMRAGHTEAEVSLKITATTLAK